MLGISLGISEVSPGIWKDAEGCIVEVDSKEKLNPRIAGLLDTLSPVVKHSREENTTRVESENGNVSHFNTDWFEWVADLAGAKLFLSEILVKNECLLFSISGDRHIVVCPIVVSEAV